ncbi:MAG: hypothetical protein OXC72_01025 [Roseovarius sp.]|nr:hypothetical protein [Roseovarius sp.]
MSIASETVALGSLTPTGDGVDDSFVQTPVRCVLLLNGQEPSNDVLNLRRISEMIHRTIGAARRHGACLGDFAALARVSRVHGLTGLFPGQGRARAEPNSRHRLRPVHPGGCGRCRAIACRARGGLSGPHGRAAPGAECAGISSAIPPVGGGIDHHQEVEPWHFIAQILAIF